MDGTGEPPEIDPGATEGPIRGPELEPVPDEDLEAYGLPDEGHVQRWAQRQTQDLPPLSPSRWARIGDLLGVSVIADDVETVDGPGSARGDDDDGGQLHQDVPPDGQDP